MLITLHQKTCPCGSSNGLFPNSWWKLNQPYHSTTVTLTYFMLLRVEKYSRNSDNDGGSDFFKGCFFVLGFFWLWQVYAW